MQHWFREHINDYVKTDRVPSVDKLRRCLGSLFRRLYNVREGFWECDKLGMQYMEIPPKNRDETTFEQMESHIDQIVLNLIEALDYAYKAKSLARQLKSPSTMTGTTLKTDIKPIPDDYR
jgi:hypothetical protein